MVFITQYVNIMTRNIFFMYLFVYFIIYDYNI